MVLAVWSIPNLFGIHRVLRHELQVNVHADVFGTIVDDRIVVRVPGAAECLDGPPQGYGGSPRLLDDVRQLVRDKALPTGGVRRVLTGTERDVAADVVGVGVHGLRRPRRRGVRVDAHLGEIVPELRLQNGARFGIQRATAAGKPLRNYRCHLWSLARRDSEDPFPLSFA
jgi:hypothetical protein